MRIRIWVRIRSKSQFEFQFNFNCHRFRGDRGRGQGRLVAIQTIAPQFMLYNLCDDHKHSRSFSICKTIFMTAPATISTIRFSAIAEISPLPSLSLSISRLAFEVNSNSLRTLYWRTSIRYNRIWPSETPSTTPTTTTTHMFKCIMYDSLCVCVCVRMCVCPTQPAGLSAENTYLNANRFWLPTVPAAPAAPADSSSARPVCRLQPRWFWSTPKYQQVVCLYCTPAPKPLQPALPRLA